MQIQRQLIFQALVALDHEAHCAGPGPSAPGYAVRFALAFLFAVTRRNDRGPFDNFWKTLIAVDRSDWGDEHKTYVRQTQLNGSIQAIMRALGLPTTPGAMAAIRLGHADGGRIHPGRTAQFWDEIARYHSPGRQMSEVRLEKEREALMEDKKM